MVDPDVSQIFRDALKEEGLDAKVTHWFEPKRQADIIRVKKTINGEPYQVEQTFTLMEQEQMNNPESFIAQRARKVAREFEEVLTERVDWHDSCVEFDMKEGHSAKCCQCGAEVDLQSLDQTSPMMAETAVPNPKTYTDFDNLSTVKIRMTLQALLKDECDVMCPNSPDYGNYRNI